MSVYVSIWASESIIVSENQNPIFKRFNQSCSVNLPLADGSKVSLVLVYRPHNLYRSEVTENENNENLCSLLREVNRPSVFIGDFNYSDIDWEGLRANKKCSRDFLEVTQDCFLTQHVNFSTRVQSNTMPDLVLSTEENLVLDVTDVGKLGSSDHSMLMVQVSGGLADNATTEMVPDWGKADFDKLRAEMSRIEWEKELTDKSTEEGLSLIHI